MKRNVLTILLSIITQIVLAQMDGNLDGRITNSAGIAITDANINLVGTQLGAQTDASGNFFINSVSSGSYILRVSYVGYQTKEIAIEIKGGITNRIADIILKSSEEQLGEVVLRGSGNINDFTRAQSDFVSKMPLKQIENPQVYNSITAELLKEQVITTFDDALKNAPGITKLWESTGRGGDGAGYFSVRAFPVQPTLV
ncbi:MAG: carboxypeptidase-like regulatory domain-containing protein, partial [Leeuwenhoekiella sp.]